MSTSLARYLGAMTAASIGLLAAAPASAQFSDDVVRIGIMNDQTGPYSDNGGPGTVIAARMAVEDFGGKITVPGPPLSE